MKAVIEMAREAQMPFYWRTGEITYLDKLERFAELVRADEREACAVIAEEAADCLQNSTFEGVAAAIRARSNTK